VERVRRGSVEWAREEERLRRGGEEKRE